ncbi:TniQ family protein [Rhodovulum visakhapatnamense]|uniref:TniQ family protein n=2 Tax=Rhodovulum visakhapatnamense TaxID=364297 RepID=A0ABS1RGB2_9RHOB|nr:TniQ family protein [Rhodovulum visakhapatnamense]MBL3578295.1 TniQ family protein [Rhodovulum visakhapatnamense]
MTMLSPMMPFDPQETLTSYADRLSMYHTGRGMARLLKDCGIHHEHFVSGRTEAVARLAEATGHPCADLHRNVIRVFQRGGEFRGEPTSKSFLLPQAKRYCPACLVEDGSPTDWRFRLIWGFRHVQRCDRHGVWLTPTSNAVATSLRVALNEVTIAVPVNATEETPTYLDWLRGRLAGDGIPETSWLADQTLEQVLAASEMIGGVLQHGHKVKLTRLSPAETEEATDIGFSIYSEGADAVEEALDTIRQTSPANAVQAGPLAYYGALFDWLDRRSNSIDPGPIRDILRNHIVKHSAVEPGTTVLGVEITERRYHTLYSLAAVVGIDRPRLSRLLKKLGEIPANATEVDCGRMVFEAATAVPMVEAFKTAVPLRDVPEYLGASKRQVETLYREGIVLPLVPRSGPGSVRHVVFGRKHLDQLLARIACLPEVDRSSDRDFHPISYACQRGAGRFERLFTEVLQGKIPAFRNPDRTGIGAIVVDVGTLAGARNAA